MTLRSFKNKTGVMYKVKYLHHISYSPVKDVKSVAGM